MRKQAAAKKAAMKKNKKAPKKAIAASKAKKPPPAKKPVKPASKPMVKAKAPEKKPLKTVAPAPAKKPVAPAPVAKKDEKKVPVAAFGKAGAKKELPEKMAVGKKGEQSRPGAVAAKAPAPIKVEPKIIETPQPEFKIRLPDQQLFANDELEVFRDLLVTERNKILAKARKAMEDGNIQIDKNEMMDEVDQASAMVDQNLTFRLLDRDRKLLSEIEHAISKLDSGDYGYCEGTGEPIPKRRLELRPWCRHSVKYKEKLERMKKSGRGVVDEDEA